MLALATATKKLPLVSAHFAGPCPGSFMDAREGVTTGRKANSGTLYPPRLWQAFGGRNLYMGLGIGYHWVKENVLTPFISYSRIDDTLYHSLMTISLLLLCKIGAEEKKNIRFKKNRDSQCPYLSRQCAQTIFLSSISAPGGKSNRQRYRIWVSFRVHVWPQTPLSWPTVSWDGEDKNPEGNVEGSLYFTPNSLSPHSSITKD